MLWFGKKEADLKTTEVKYADLEKAGHTALPQEAKTETEDKSFTHSSAFIKAKGIAKIGFGAFVLLQPYWAFAIGAVACTAWVASSTVSAFRDPKTQDVPWTTKLKNALGKETGAMIGLLAPYVGIGIAAFGGLSYLGNHAEGAQGLFQGSLMATAVGTVGLPVLGCAFIADGLVNSLGYETHFMSKGLSFVSHAYSKTKQLLGIAESGPDKQKEVIHHITQQSLVAGQMASKGAHEVGAQIAPTARNIVNNAKEAGALSKESAQTAQNAIENPHGIMDKFKSMIGMQREQSTDPASRGK